MDVVKARELCVFAYGVKEMRICILILKRKMDPKTQYMPSEDTSSGKKSLKDFGKI